MFLLLNNEVGNFVMEIISLIGLTSTIAIAIAIAASQRSIGIGTNAKGIKIAIAAIAVAIVVPHHPSGSCSTAIVAI